MKKFLFALLAFFASTQMSFADDVVTQDPNRLPLTARNFVNQHFTNPKYSYIKINDDFLSGKSYEVRLGDDTEIDFDKNGDWESVDCKQAAVPEALIPASVKNYVKVNFSGEKITKIERDNGNTEIELGNDVSLEFDANGKIVDMDN